MKRLLPVITAFVGLLVGVSATHAYHLRVARQEAATQRVVSALGHIASAHVTLSLLKQQRVDPLTDLCMRTLTENIAVAHEGISTGVSLHDQPIPNLTEALRRATVLLRGRGAAPEVIAQAETVLSRLPAPSHSQP